MSIAAPGGAPGGPDVGDEIAVGTWRSRGEGDGCYWATYDEDGNILDSRIAPGH